MAADEREILQNYLDEMPSFSPATQKVLALAREADTSAAEIVAAIRLDPVLTGRVLHLVNSAYFGLAQKITSLNRAVVYLGINTIRHLALSTAVMEALDTENAAVAARIAPTWQHSLATAVCAKALARAAHVPPTHVEEYFVGGLLHKIGEIVLLQAFHANVPAGSFEDTDVCAETLRHWKFSDDFVAGVSGYRHPTNALACFVHVANAMTYRMQLHGEPEPVEEPISPEAWDTVGLSEAQVEEALASASEQIAQAEIFLNITRAPLAVEQA